VTFYLTIVSLHLTILTLYHAISSLYLAILTLYLPIACYRPTVKSELRHKHAILRKKIIVTSYHAILTFFVSYRDTFLFSILCQFKKASFVTHVF